MSHFRFVCLLRQNGRCFGRTFLLATQCFRLSCVLHNLRCFVFPVFGGVFRLLGGGGGRHAC